MSYRDDRAAQEERRANLQSELEEIRTLRRKLSDAAQAEKRLENDLRDVEAQLGGEASLLARIRIASPCNQSWDDMVGDERMRFCAGCQKNVYNLPAMTYAEAEALIRETEGKICARIARRRDGTVVTSDCPVGAKKKRVRLAVLSAAGAGALACAATGAMMQTRMGEIHSTRVAVGGLGAPVEDPQSFKLGEVVATPVVTEDEAARGPYTVDQADKRQRVPAPLPPSARRAR